MLTACSRNREPRWPLALGLAAVAGLSVLAVSPGCGARSTLPAPPVCLGPLDLVLADRPAVGDFPISIVATDLNGDGAPDLAVASHGGDSATVLMNRGDGSFAPAVDYSTGVVPYSLAAGDLDGDGRPDLVVVTEQKLSVLLNRGDGTFLPAVDYDCGPTPTAVAVADLDGDGWNDLAVAVRTGVWHGVVRTLLNQGAGTFAAPAEYDVGVAPLYLVAADLNGDGRPDVATEGYGEELDVLLNQGDGTLAASVPYPMIRADGAMAVADLNGDGSGDLGVVSYQESQLAVFLNRGNGTFAAAVDYPTGPLPAGVAVGDMDLDGDPDLVVTNAPQFLNFGQDGVSVFSNRGDGTFAEAAVFPVGPEDATLPFQPLAVAVADLDGDGRPDVATANYGDNTVSVLLNRCDE